MIDWVPRCRLDQPGSQRCGAPLNLKRAPRQNKHVHTNKRIEHYAGLLKRYILKHGFCHQNEVGHHHFQVAIFDRCFFHASGFVWTNKKDRSRFCFSPAYLPTPFGTSGLVCFGTSGRGQCDLPIGGDGRVTSVAAGASRAVERG